MEKPKLVVPLAVDCGRRYIKVYGDNNYRDLIPANFGSARYLNLVNEQGHNDIRFECELGDFFFGDLSIEAEDNTKLMLENKIHTDTKIQILCAVARAVPSGANVILTTGLPIKFHNEDQKQRMINLLKGVYSVKVNGIEKTFNIAHVIVSVECISAYTVLCHGRFERVRFIELGSTVMNYGEMNVVNGSMRRIDKTSGSTDFGCDTQKLTVEAFARLTMAEISQKWRDGFDVATFLFGGGTYKYGEAFKEWLPQMKIPDEPEWVTVKAYFEVCKQLASKVS